MTSPKLSGAALSGADRQPGSDPASVQGKGCVGAGPMSCDHLATVQVYRDFDGTYAVDVDFGGHGEWNGGFATLDGAFERCREVVRDDLRKRPTLPEMDPIPRLLPDDVP